MPSEEGGVSDSGSPDLLTNAIVILYLFEEDGSFGNSRKYNHQLLFNSKCLTNWVENHWRIKMCPIKTLFLINIEWFNSTGSIGHLITWLSNQWKQEW